MIICPINCCNSSSFNSDKVCFASSKSGQSNQRGITLIVGIIFLAMLMVVTVIGFRNTTLSERMTGNAFDRNTSFQSAENAAKEAHDDWNTFDVDKVSGDGYYSSALPDGGNSDFWNKGAGAAIAPAACATTKPFSWASCSKPVSQHYKFETNANGAHIAQPAQYVIERLDGSTYRVTTRSTGGSGEAEVVLQMIQIRP